jgi:predicted RNase H-like nuclease
MEFKMKKIEIKKINMSMSLNIEGHLQMMENEENGYIFELHNEYCFILAYLQPKSKKQSFEESVNEQLEVLKNVDFTNIKMKTLQKIGDMSQAVIKQYKKIIGSEQEIKIVKITKGKIEQIQFFVNLDTYLLVIGLNILNKSLELDNDYLKTMMEKILYGINSLKVKE